MCEEMVEERRLTGEKDASKTQDVSPEYDANKYDTSKYSHVKTVQESQERVGWASWRGFKCKFLQSRRGSIRTIGCEIYVVMSCRMFGVFAEYVLWWYQARRA